MPEKLLEMTGISKAFGGPKVLDDVAFDLRPGEVHVLAGENGAGKSTLMRILSGVYTEYEGVMRVRGTHVRFRSPQDAAKQGISIIHQELSLAPEMSVADNIFLGRETVGPAGWLHYGRERAACKALLRRLGIEAAPNVPAGAYPMGVQQGMEIAKALAFDATIIIMDEPTSALTEPEAERLFAVMESLKKQGCGIVYISHKMEEIYRVADRITVLRDGRRIGVATPDALPRKQMIQWMVGRSLDEQFQWQPHEPGDVALTLHNVTVPDPGGRARPAAKDVSFTVHAGEIVGLAGLQGAGAEALIYGLYGAYGRVVQGDILLCGEPYTPRSPRDAMRRGLVFLSSDRKGEGLVQGMSVTQNITLPALPTYSPWGGLRERWERRAAREREKAFGIRVETVEQPVHTLSGGNQQKVVLAKCLETNPHVLLLNEPTRGVDVGAKHEIYGLMAAWSAAGKAIVLITSEMPELIALSDRIVVLHQGYVTARLDRGTATPEVVLEAAMGNVAKT